VVFAFSDNNYCVKEGAGRRLVELDVIWKLGNGAGTFFWTGWWLGEVLLCDRFRRLF